jgi:hypothetical protein
VNALLSFAAALLSLRLAGLLLRGRRPAWAAGLVSFAAAGAAMAWGSSHGWDAASFRVYYLAGALLAAPLLGVGSLQLAGVRHAGHVGTLWTGLAIGLAAEMHVRGVGGTAVPRAQDHVDTLARVAAIGGSSFGTAAVVVVAALTLRRRPLRNVLLLAAVAAAAAASALTQTAVAAAAACFALASALLYAAASRR